MPGEPVQAGVLARLATMTSTYHTTRIIEFADTDMAGIVHFARFFVFMEAAEHEFLRSLGLSVHLERDGDTISWPRLGASCEYLSPIRFEDRLNIHLRIARKGTKSLTYAFDFAHGEVEVAHGELKVVCCVCNLGEKMRAIPIPDFMADQIEAAPPESSEAG